MYASVTSTAVFRPTNRSKAMLREHKLTRPRRRWYVLGMLARLPILLCLLALQADAADFTGKVVGISDGDTIKVMHDSTPEKIRLSAIDCPEKGQAFGNKAKEATAALCFGKTARVVWNERDRYGRTLGEAYVDGKNVNRELVKNGWAWHYKRYSNSKELDALEAEARKQKLGLWRDLYPVPPWEFRRHEREQAASKKAVGK